MNATITLISQSCLFGFSNAKVIGYAVTQKKQDAAVRRIDSDTKFQVFITKRNKITRRIPPLTEQT